MHGKTAVVLQDLFFVTTTNCAVSVYMHVFELRGRSFLNTTTWTIPSHNFFELQEHPRSTVAVQPQPQRYNTIEHHIAYYTVYATLSVVYHPTRVYTAQVIKRIHPKTTT